MLPASVSDQHVSPSASMVHTRLTSADYETALGGSGAVGGGQCILLPPLLPADWTRLLLLRLLQAQLVQGHGVLPQLRPGCQLSNTGHTWREQKDQDMVVRTR